MFREARDPSRRSFLAAGAAALALLPCAARAAIPRYDVVVYGGTAGGGMAAAAACSRVPTWRVAA